MRVAPIPKSMLGGSVDFYVPVEGDYGGEYAAEPKTVRGVYFEPSESVSASSYRLVDGCRGLLFIDAASSIGAFKPPVSSLAVIGGEEMSVASVAEYRTPTDVHHWEVQLV